MTNLQRSARWTRTSRVVTFFAIALNVFILAMDMGSALVLVPAACLIALLALSVAQTRILGTIRRRERELEELSRPRMTAEDWRELRELEIGLGWEPSEPPDPPTTGGRGDGGVGLVTDQDGRPETAGIFRNADGSHSVDPAIRRGEFPDPRPPYTGPLSGTGSLSAPMTGPGGRWHPVSEMAEHDARAAETAAHFAALARLKLASCISPCPMCAERDAGSETIETMRQWLETDRWETKPAKWPAVVSPLPPVGARDWHLDGAGREWYRDADDLWWMKPTPDSLWHRQNSPEGGGQS